MSMTPGATARPIASMRHVTDNALIEKVERLFLAVVHAFPYMLRIGFAIHASLFSSLQGATIRPFWKSSSGPAYLGPALGFWENFIVEF